jgi:hypothetical protein
MIAVEGKCGKGANENMKERWWRLREKKKGGVQVPAGVEQKYGVFTASCTMVPSASMGTWGTEDRSDDVGVAQIDDGENGAHPCHIDLRVGDH